MRRWQCGAEWVGLALVAATVGGLAADAAEPAASAGTRLYPEGRRFPLGLYSIHSVAEMAEAGPAGWNMGHTYGFKPEYLKVIDTAGWTCLAPLSGMTKVAAAPDQAQTPAAPPAAVAPAPAAAVPGAANPEEKGETAMQPEPKERPQAEAEAQACIEALAASERVAWWDLPEELRYWRPDEYSLLQNLSAWTRKYDPRQRPNFMYIPGHHDADAVAKCVPYLDIIGAGTYTEYAHQPRAWVRWRTEQCVKAIKLAGFEIGPDYKRGQKTPIGIPMLFGNGIDMGVITPVAAYHDFWSCIAAGARGILVFSYFHQRDVDVLRKTWELGYKRAAANLMRDGKLDQAILFGEDVPLTVEIIDGPPTTVSFRPYGCKEDLLYPAVNVLAKRHEGTLYIITVSSQERPVKARFSGLPPGLGAVQLLFEDRPVEQGGVTLTVKDGAFEDHYPWLTVHVYKAAPE